MKNEVRICCEIKLEVNDGQVKTQKKAMSGLLCSSARQKGLKKIYRSDFKVKVICSAFLPKRGWFLLIYFISVFVGFFMMSHGLFNSLLSSCPGTNQC